ncbi:MAG: hypothetical protein SO168_04540 [Muribaculaceae bacterium]|nr:hypothetical protein [Muribaculaceae bacterium]
MKKISILLLSAMALGAFTACDDAPAEPPMQSNPQEPVLTVGDITSTPSLFLTNPPAVVNLADYAADNGLIPVLTRDEVKNLPAGAEVKYYFQISPVADFSKDVKDINVEFVDNNQGYVDANRWNEAQIAFFGKNPNKVHTIYYRIPVYVTLDGTEYRYDSTDYYVSKGQLDVKCIDTGFVIYDNYYLLSDCTTWSFDDITNFKFDHSDADVYDDPVFTYSLTVPADKSACYLKIAPQNAVDVAAEGGNGWDYVYGSLTDGDENLEGNLTDTNPGAIKLASPGNYIITINMEDLTYKLELLTRPQYLYTPGAVNGWQFPDCSLMQYDENVGYYGIFAVTGGFKICTATTWADADTYGAAADHQSDLTGTFDSPGKDITIPNGFYYAFAKYDEATGKLTTYTFTEVTSVGLIGSFPASGWNDVEMTTADGGITWTATAEFNAGDKFKIRVNHDWDGFNLGADQNNPGKYVYKGGDIVVDEAGTYTVTLVTQPGVPTIKLTKQ